MSIERVEGYRKRIIPKRFAANTLTFDRLFVLVLGHFQRYFYDPVGSLTLMTTRLISFWPLKIYIVDVRGGSIRGHRIRTGSAMIAPPRRSHVGREVIAGQGLTRSTCHH